MPVLPLMAVLAIILMLFFEPAMWPRYACPFGTILQLPGKISRYGWAINIDKCNKRLVCKKVCPAGGRIKK
jgi:polyferredoxin